MEKIRTHYDNLKVSRDAPDFVIRAAYRTLSQRYHPDKNQGDGQAARIMSILNQSYEVLSDPVRRRAHDDWIARAEAELKAQQRPRPSAPGHQPHARPNPSPRPAERYTRQQPSQSPPAPRPPKPTGDSLIGRMARSWFVWGVIIVGLIVWSGNQEDRARPTASASRPSSSPVASQPSSPARAPARRATQAKPAYVRPAVAPNGSPWPARAGYVAGYPVSRADGHSNLTIDNTRNDSDVHLKLISLDGGAERDARHVYIPKGARFTMRTLSPGQYDIRYRDLESGQISGSEKFEIEESQTRSGIQYSEMTITLYKVAHGNFNTFRLGEDQF